MSLPSGQYPLLKPYTATQNGVIALYALENDCTATVGNNFTTVYHVGAGGSYNHDSYVKFGKGFYQQVGGVPGNEQGYSYGVASGDANVQWAFPRTWVFLFQRRVASDTFYGVLSGVSNGGATTFLHGFNGGFQVWMSDNAQSVQITLTPNAGLVDVNDGKIHTSIFVSESASSHKLYIDGVLHDSSSTNITVGNGNDVNICADGYGHGSHPWDGWMDQVAVFSKAFTARECHAFGGGLVV